MIVQHIAVTNEQIAELRMNKSLPGVLVVSNETNFRASVMNHF